MRKGVAPIQPPPDARVAMAASLAAACLFIASMTLLAGDTPAGAVLLDTGSTVLPYPFTIQNLMYMLFFPGLGEVYVRWRVALREYRFTTLGYLPEDDFTVLQPGDLGPIRKAVASDFDDEHGFLPSLVDLCILQFQAGRSVDQTVSVLNSALELVSRQVDLRYSMLRYICWAIPTFGFVGTVVGIARTLARVDPAAPDLRELTSSLAVAFNTTLVALVLAAVLVFLVHVAQKKEESSVNQAGRYVLKNLVNRLYAGDR